VYQRTGDKELLEQCLRPIERFHEWYWRERDVTNVGLVAIGAYSGVTQHARYETFDYECNMDGLKMTPHPTRRGDKEGAWYGDICTTGNTAYLIIGEKSLLRLAEIMGDKEMAARRKVRIDKSVEAMRKHMWDEDAGTFLSVKRDTLEKIPVGTIGSWIPLTAGVPTEAMAKRMAETLQTPGWSTPLPVPTVDGRDKRRVSDRFCKIG
jgi:putative isomerase